MRKRILTKLGILLLMAFVIIGGVFAKGQSEKEAKAEEEAEWKVAMLMSGPINDGGWNEFAYEALKDVESNYDAEIAYTENVKKSEQKAIIRNYARKGFDVIFGHGFEYGDAILEVAKDFPEVYFVNIGGVAEAENVASGVFRTGELSYLVGKLAAKFTKTDKIGFVGAQEIPTIVHEVETIKNTVPKFNPDATVTVAYTGSWTDVNKGKEAALAQINNGVDVIIAIGDACDYGAIKAAQQEGAYVIGWVGDFNEVAPEVVLTSGIQGVPDLVDLYMEDIVTGEFVGENKVYGIVEGVQYPGTWADVVPEDLKQEIMADYRKIKNGEFDPQEWLGMK